MQKIELCEEDEDWKIKGYFKNVWFHFDKLLSNFTARWECLFQHYIKQENLSNFNVVTACVQKKLHFGKQVFSREGLFLVWHLYFVFSSSFTHQQDFSEVKNCAGEKIKMLKISALKRS